MCITSSLDTLNCLAQLVIYTFKQVLVIGCGAIGLFAMAVSKAKGNLFVNIYNL